MEKINLIVTVPSIGETFNIKVPVQMKINVVSELILQALSEKMKCQFTSDKTALLSVRMKKFLISNIANSNITNRLTIEGTGLIDNDRVMLISVL